ncbi:hypothetical protein EMIT0P228_70046 [Pseudomonas brassicacearum]
MTPDQAIVFINFLSIFEIGFKHLKMERQFFKWLKPDGIRNPTDTVEDDSSDKRQKQDWTVRFLLAVGKCAFSFPKFPVRS